MATQVLPHTPTSTTPVCTPTITPALHLVSTSSSAITSLVQDLGFSRHLLYHFLITWKFTARKSATTVPMQSESYRMHYHPNLCRSHAEVRVDASAGAIHQVNQCHTSEGEEREREGKKREVKLIHYVDVVSMIQHFAAPAPSHQVA